MAHVKEGYRRVLSATYTLITSGMSHSYLYRQTHTHTHPFNGPLSGTTQVSRYQKGKTNLDFSEERDSEWQWHQLGHMQICTSLQTNNHASTPPPLSFYRHTHTQVNIGNNKVANCVRVKFCSNYWQQSNITKKTNIKKSQHHNVQGRKP